MVSGLLESEKADGGKRADGAKNLLIGRKYDQYEFKDREGKMGFAIRQAEEHFAADSLYGSVGNWAELLQYLKRISDLKVPIKSFFMYVHGELYRGRSLFALTNERGQHELFSFMDFSREQVQLSFTKFAFVSTSACKILPADPETALSLLRSSANSMGLRSGLIYGNVSMGVDAEKDFYGEPFYNFKGWHAQVVVGAAQIFWPIVRPGTMAVDRLFNQGYAFLLDEQGHEALIRTNLVDIRSGKIGGTLVFFRP